MFAENEALHVGQSHHHVDDGKARFRKILRHRLDAAGLREADADDRVSAAFGKAPRRLFALHGVLDFVFEVGLAPRGES